MCDGENGWELNLSDIIMVEVQVSVFVVEILVARFVKFLSWVRELFGVGVVLGCYFDFVLVGELIGCELFEVVCWCEYCRGRFIWVDGWGGSYIFVYDCIREILLGSFLVE